MNTRMLVPTIEWEDGITGRVKIIDQTLLPVELRFIYLDSVEDMWQAIKKLQVRGAPAIGIAAAMGVVLGIRRVEAKDFKEFFMRLKEVTGYLATSRPTAVNLFWALRRMEKVAQENSQLSVKELKEVLFREALQVLEEDRTCSRQIGEYGASLVENGSTVMTYCNAGGLATGGYGTALAVIYACQEQGKNIKVFACETRPLLQGARLTAWELKQAGLDVTLICDNMAAVVLRQGKVDSVVVGADRIAANGDTANKIGTYTIALAAREHKIPFYVAAPSSTFDLSIPSEERIPIEERGAEEIINGFGRRTAPEGIKVYNPAFDVVPARMITAIITEKGVIKSPNATSIKKVISSSAKPAKIKAG